MSGESQKWNNAVQIGFGDEIGQDTLNDYWPSSTQSPGPSPQPSPDSQLLEPPPASSEASALNQTNLKSSTNQNVQTPTYSCQQSSLVSQSNLPQNKQSTGLSSQSQSSSTSSSPQIESQGGAKTKNAFPPPNPSSQQGIRPPPPSFQTSPPKSQKAPPQQNSNENSNVHYQQYNVGGPVRPSSAGQHNIRPQIPGSAQEPRPKVLPSPQAPVGSLGPPHPRMSQPRTHNAPSGHQQQQQHFQPQASPIRQPQFAGQQRPNVPPGHLNSPRAGSHNQYVPNARPQMSLGPPNPRLSSPGQPPNPCLRMGQHPPPGRMVRPPHPANVGPRMAGPRMPGGPRFSGQVSNQVRLPPQGMQHNTLEHGPYPDFDGEDEEDMYYDEEDDEDEFDEIYRDMPYDHEYDSDGSMSSSSDEDHMMLREYVECDDDARAEYLYEQLKARGVPPEEIEDFKENYVRQRNYDEIDYDEEMDEEDEDEDEYPDEEMVSSSTPLNSNLGGMQHSMLGPRYPGQPGTGVRPSKVAPCSSPSSSSSLRHTPQGAQSGPRPQGPRGPPPQRFAAPLQRKPVGQVPQAAPGSTSQQGNPVPPRPPQPRLPSPVKSQASGQTFQGANIQKQGSALPQSSPSSTEGSTFNPRHSSPLQQNSPTGPANVRAPSPHPSAPQTPVGAPAPSTSHPQHSSSNADHVPMSQGQPSPTRPPPSQSGPAGYSAPTEATNYGAAGQPGPFTMRPVHPRPPAPRQPNRFAPPHVMGGQTNTSMFHANPRMATSAISSPRMKAALAGGKVPSEAHLARMAVLEMQKSLDKEIMAKKGIPMASHPPSHQRQFAHPNFHGVHHQHPGRPRLQNMSVAGSSQFVRHQLPPRTPFPRTHGPRPTRVQTARPVCSVPPFTSHTPQQPAVPPGPRPPNQGVVGNVPRPQNATSSQYPVNPVQSHVPNRMAAPLNVQPIVTMAPVVGGSPSPRNAPPSQVANQPEASFDQSRPVQGQESAGLSGQSQPPQAQSGQQVQQSQQQQPQQAPCKSESFNLCSLSEDKFIVKGKQRLVTNTVYQIKSPVDQTSKLARWNGERFEDLEPYVEKPATSQAKGPLNQPAPQVSGSNSVTQATPTQSPINQPQIRTDNAVNKEPGVAQSTYVKPMTEENKTPLPKTNPPVEENEDEFVFKKPLNENEEQFRVCNYCGYTSKNFRQCEGCKRIFQGAAKIHIQKKKPQGSPSSPSTSSAQGRAPGEPFCLKRPQSEENNPDPHKEIMANVDFYGNRRGRGRPPRGSTGRTRGGGVKGRMGGRKGPDDYDSSDSEDSVDKQSSESSADLPVKRKVGRGRSRNSAPRKKSKKLDEPVTVMISSDEDEPSSTSNMPQGSGPVPSPVNSTGSESPIFPGRHIDPPSTYGRFRRMFMEDEQGNSKISKKLQQQALSARGLEDEDFDEEDEDEDENEPPTYEIEIRSIRIGSMRTKPEGPLFINMRGVCFRVISERTEEAFECEIMSQEVEYVKYFGGQSPVLFFLITHECGEKLREIFRMEEGGDEYLDPSSTDLKKKMVVIIVESSNYLPQDMRETLSLWADINHVDDGDFIEELSEESANDLLIQSAPAVLTADVEHDMVSFKKSYMKSEGGNLSVMPKAQASPPGVADNEPDSTSSSPPQQTELHHYFDGPPVRLLQYPPPPARGIPITTEDLICLHEGEFLNDVIIDFYLQYLYQEKLSDDLRGRTHIFSSFFYKRLTQRDRHNDRTEEDAKKSLPERRHARVRKWTKTVDLFDKDFIIVPINENSHWYLAVVCYPGLASPEVVPYIPSTAHRGDTESDNNDAESSQEGTSISEEKTNAPEPPIKTILGKTVDPKLCSNNDEVKYSYGQKAPCILMFDSLAGPSRNPNVKMLRDYLQCEWNAKKTEARMITKLLRGTTPKVPQQSNFSDCGVYLLQYVESFFEDPIADFQIPMKGLQQWFSEKLIMTKRREIHELIMKLHRRFQEERGDPKILDIKYESCFPREDPPPPFPHPDQQQHPHPEQQHPPHHHPVHPQHHLPHPGMPPPQDEQHWQGHPGYQEVADPFAPSHAGDMDPGGFMDSGDSSNSNSGSMTDMDEQNFLYLSSQENTQQSEEQQASFGQGNVAAPKSGLTETSEQNQSASCGGNGGDDAENQNKVSEPLLDFLSHPAPVAEPQKDEDENTEESLPVSDDKMGSDENNCLNTSTEPTNAASLSEQDTADSQEDMEQSAEDENCNGSQETQ